MLTQSALDELKRSIREVAGDEPACEVLFRLGRTIGERRAEPLQEPEQFVEAVDRGIRQLKAFGVGLVDLAQVYYAPDKHLCRVQGRIVTQSLELGADPRDQGSEGATCSVAAGYMTGLTSGLTGYDMVCDWLTCPGTCGKVNEGRNTAGSCTFVIRPAYLGPPLRADEASVRRRRRPQGSARFFLGDVGASLGESEISLADLVDSTSDAIVMVDLDDIVRFWNKGAERMFGHTRHEIVGKPLAIIVPEDLVAGGEMEWIAERILQSDSLDNHLTRRVTRDGRVLLVSLTRTSLRNADGKVIGSTVVLRDETERKRIEAALEQARHLAMIGEMSATVAHDIKNPLAGIYAAVQYLGRGNPTEAERRELLDEVGLEVHRVDETIQDLLRFAHTLPPNPEQVLASEFVEEVLATMTLSPEMNRHELEVDVEEGLEVPIDREMLGRVLRNLLINASQAMESPGRLRIHVWCDEESAVFDICDTGSGVPAHLTDSLFTPFVTSKARGTGLGLPIARKHVESHGGQLHLLQTGNQGSVFRFTVPMRVPRLPGLLLTPRG